MNHLLIYYNFYTDFDMASHNLYGTLIMTTRWIVLNYIDLYTRPPDDFKSRDHMYPWVRRFIFIEIGATIYMKILLASLSVEHIYNVHQYVVPSYWLIVSIRENCHHILMRSLNTMIILSLLHVLLVIVTSRLQTFLEWSSDVS